MEISLTVGQVKANFRVATPTLYFDFVTKYTRSILGLIDQNKSNARELCYLLFVFLKEKQEKKTKKEWKNLQQKSPSLQNLERLQEHRR